ncbi:MAG TPA: glycosyltransferase [Bosea sp. (in: a-proteobacteria)]|jgi:hypothetical protein|uniref:glycosyltransferase family 2 protein n=1 Tax=Bosea sp. (in: a-proteobacteria) TaxID=1871050 RepID=UPI002E126771|nr:glycosyltransferase [Bosea sp. (in: a-proteobacteria)]
MIVDDFLRPIRLDRAGNPAWPLPALTAPQQDGWLLLCDNECQLNPKLAEFVLRKSAERPDIAVFYGDEVVAAPGSAGEPVQILKPDFDLTQLQATDYIGWPLVIKARVFAAVAPNCLSGSGAFSYELLLRTVSAGHAVGRIAEVLSARGAPMLRASPTDRRSVLKRWTDENNPDCEVEDGRIAGAFRLSRRFEHYPAVTLVIPTRQAICEVGAAPMRGRPHILNMLDSLSRSSWPADRLTVLIGDDAPDGSAYEGRAWPFALRRVWTARPAGAPFNYARKMNELWRQAETEHVILMNDDLVVRNPDWIEALLTFSMQEDVGGAGARLLYPDDRIQHAGMAGGPMGACTHVFIGMPANEPTYLNWADIHREWSMVTGAAFATRRSLLAQIGGFDERLSLEFNDVDMCMRMRMLGYRIVYTPHAELTHFESASRGATYRPGSEVALFLQRWRELLADDPAYHPRLPRRSTNPTAAANAMPLWFG